MSDLEQFTRTIGLFGIFGVVFAETGLLIGFFLPGDSLLFTAGFLASQGVFEIWPLSLGCFAACVLGNVVAYAFGARVGRRLFERPDSHFFQKRHLVKAHAFYEQHGAKALLLARFIPAVRVFAPVIAGVSAMDYRKFTIVNVVGGALWAIGLTWAGYRLGQSIPNVDRYLLPIVVLIVVVSVLPAVIHVWRDREQREAVLGFVRKMFGK